MSTDLFFSLSPFWEVRLVFPVGVNSALFSLMLFTRETRGSKAQNTACGGKVIYSERSSGFPETPLETDFDFHPLPSHARDTDCLQFVMWRDKITIGAHFSAP